MTNVNRIEKIKKCVLIIFSVFTKEDAESVLIPKHVSGDRIGEIHRYNIHNRCVKQY